MQICADFEYCVCEDGSWWLHAFWVKQMEIWWQVQGFAINIISWLTWLLQCDASNTIPTIARRHIFLYSGCITAAAADVAVWLIQYTGSPFVGTYLFQCYNCCFVFRFFVCCCYCDGSTPLTVMFVKHSQWNENNSPFFLYSLWWTVKTMFSLFLCLYVALFCSEQIYCDEKSQKYNTNKNKYIQVTWITNDCSYNRGSLVLFSSLFLLVAWHND